MNRQEFLRQRADLLRICASAYLHTHCTAPPPVGGALRHVQPWTGEFGEASGCGGAELPGSLATPVLAMSALPATGLGAGGVDRTTRESAIPTWQGMARHGCFNNPKCAMARVTLPVERADLFAKPGVRSEGSERIIRGACYCWMKPARGEKGLLQAIWDRGTAMRCR